MFEARLQSFEERSERAASGARLAALRAELERRGLDGFIVPRADRHQNEYVPPSEERLAWLTGFTGSAGAAIVLADRAAIFVDGRYLLQVRDQVDTALFAVEHLVDNPPEKWLEANLKSGARFGYDPWLHTADNAERLAKACAAAGATAAAAEPNPIDTVWADRPAPPLGAVTIHDLKFAGEPAADKLARIRAEIGKLKAEQLIVSDPHNVAWAFNIRGSDVSYTPLPLAFAAVPKEGRPALYIDGRKLSNETRDYLETLADVREPAAFAEDLKTLGAAHATVRLDQATAADALSRIITEAGGEVVRGADPITLMKAVKNAVEIAGTRAAHTRDGAAVASFLAWFEREAPGGKLTEIDAVAALESFRRDTGLLKDVSFPTISGTGPNGAIVHYRVTEATNRKIAPGELFLIDSGAQYQDGTTDITRTIAVGAPTPEMRERFTRVLKGHIAIARGVSGGHQRRAARPVRAPAFVGSRHRFRPRHRPRRRQLPVGARRPGAHFQARHGAAAARHDPVERARLLQGRRLRHPHREPRARHRSRGRRGRREAAQCVRDADARADRPPRDRAGVALGARDRVDRCLSRARRRDADAACRRRHAPGSRPPQGRSVLDLLSSIPLPLVGRG